MYKDKEFQLNSNGGKKKGEKRREREEKKRKSKKKEKKKERGLTVSSNKFIQSTRDCKKYDAVQHSTAAQPHDSTVK